MYCIKTATKNPMGLIVSNGNLWLIQWKLNTETINGNSMNKNDNKMYYHIGNDNSKAEPSKSVVKYLKKLTINAGHTNKTGKTFV